MRTEHLAEFFGQPGGVFPNHPELSSPFRLEERTGDKASLRPIVPLRTPKLPDELFLLLRLDQEDRKSNNTCAERIFPDPEIAASWRLHLPQICRL